jgi:gliding motility-associated-like protein
MKRFSPFVLLVLQLFSLSTNSQNTSCLTALPFCTQHAIEYRATRDISYSEAGHDYGCLLYTKNPAWFYLLIEKAGDIQLRLSSKPSADIDFICWGPFSSVENACLTGCPSSSVVDCGKEISHIEFCNIPLTAVGEYYILMITNYSNNDIRILLEQSGGAGRTDCTIVNPPTLMIPNAFSPNGDGQNDVFNIIGENISFFKMTIYDRWGRIAFETSDQYKGWDGTIGGYPAQLGLYSYYIYCEGYALFETIISAKIGYVMLLR